MFTPEERKIRQREAHKRWVAKNPSGVKEYAQAWRENNREKFKKYKKKYRSLPGNREKELKSLREWQQQNKEHRRTYHREWLRNRRLESPEFRLLESFRNRMRQALKNNYKTGATLALTGCSISDLRHHLEKQFQPGMTWENYGPVWHVDHIKPCAKFDLSQPEQQRQCFHFSNLQPLLAEDNLRKGDR